MMCEARRPGADGAQDGAERLLDGSFDAPVQPL